MSGAARLALGLLLVGCVRLTRDPGPPPEVAPVPSVPSVPDVRPVSDAVGITWGREADTARLQLREQPYRVEGRTAGELSAALERQRPALGGFLGRTSWRIQFTAQPVRDGSGCKLDAVVVAIDATVDLPQWNAPAGTDGALLAQWQRFRSALRAHEAQHVEHAREAGAATVRDLRALRAPCESIGAAATGIGQRITAQFQARDRDLDARTRNGATDGAVWPAAASSP